MVITGYADKIFTENFKKLIESNSKIGLLIGHKADDDIFLTHMFSLPEAIEKEFSGNEQANKNESDFILTLPESIMTSHACQVARMLPGGLDVLGIFVISPSDEIDNSAFQGKLKSLLLTIRKSTSKYFLSCFESSFNLLVLHGCPQTSKYSLRTIDLSEHGSQLVNVSLKSREIEWAALNFTYSLKYSIFFPPGKGLQSLRKSVLTAMTPWAKSLHNHKFLINDRQYNEDDLVFSDLNEDLSKEKTLKQLEGRVTILEPSSTPKDENGIEEGVKECSGTVAFSGTVAGKAFVQCKTSMVHVADAIKKDLVRSFVSRWEMHCDSLVEEPQGSSPGTVVHEPPRRVFFKDKGSSFILCDYLFPGDSVSDTCQSAEEVLGLRINPEEVIDTLEIWADPEEFQISPEIQFDNGHPNECLKKVRWLKRSNSIQVLLAIIFALLALFISYYIIVQK